MNLKNKIIRWLQPITLGLTYEEMVKRLGLPDQSHPEATLREIAYHTKPLGTLLPITLNLLPDTPFRHYVYLDGDGAHHYFFVFDGSNWRLAHFYDYHPSSG